VAEALELGSPGWLERLLELYFEHHDEQRLRDDLAVVRAEAAPEESLEALAERLAHHRLAHLHLLQGRELVPAELEAALEPEGLSEDDLTTVGLLATQWDLLQSISLVYENEGGPLERALEILTVMALGLRAAKLARKLHAAHLDVAAGKKVNFAKLAGKVEKKLAPKGQLPGGQALRVGLGLAYLEARALAQIAATYYERAVVEEEGLALLYGLGRSRKVQLVEVLLALAWADGTIALPERRLIEQQIALAALPKAESRALLAKLDQPVERPQLEPTDPATRRFFLEQAALISLVDDEQDPSERQLLREIAQALGGSPEELDQVLIEVMAFYAHHRDCLHAFGPVSGERLEALKNSLTARAQKAVRLNLDRVLQEIRETGELALLLGAASVRELTPEEGEKVKAQLLDVCKTIPALGIFLLPGGGLLLPVLMKALPFNILPSAFSEPPLSDPLNEAPPS